jgi:hypothetical protein
MLIIIGAFVFLGVGDFVAVCVLEPRRRGWTPSGQPAGEARYCWLKTTTLVQGGHRRHVPLPSSAETILFLSENK